MAMVGGTRWRGIEGDFEAILDAVENPLFVGEQIPCVLVKV